MKTHNKLTLLFIVFSMLSSVVYANIEQVTNDQIRADFKNNNIKRYLKDTFPEWQDTKLFGEGWLQKKADTNTTTQTVSAPTVYSESECQTILNDPIGFFKCPAIKEGYVSSLYDLNLEGGYAKCTVTSKANLYKPLAWYKFEDEGLKSCFKSDIKQINSDLKTKIDNASTQFSIINDVKNEYDATSTLNQDKQYLTATDILLSALLTDNNRIDFESSLNSNQIILQSGYYSGNGIKTTQTVTVNASSVDANDVKGFWDTLKYKVTAITGIQTQVQVQQKLNEIEYKLQDNSSLLSSDIVSLFEAHVRLSNVSLNVLFSLIIIIASVQGGLFFVKNRLDKNETPVGIYLVSILSSFMLFFPGASTKVTDADTNQVYNLASNNFQSFSRDGYYFFSDFADDLSKVIIDMELSNMANKASVFTSNQILDNAKNLKKEELLTDSYLSSYNHCTQIYDTNLTSQFAEDPNLPFASSESYMYSNVVGQGFNTAYYHAGNNYIKDPNQEYADVVISGCGKIYNKYLYHKNMLSKYQTSLDSVDGSSDKAQKLAEILKLQYGLYKDFGWLSIISYPIIQLQAQLINLVPSNDSTSNKYTDENNNNSLIQKSLNKLVYFLIPGANSVMNVFAGALSGGQIAVDSISKIPIVGSIVGLVLSPIKYATGKAGAAAATAVFLNLVVSMLPLVFISAIAIIRLGVIISKIFIFHFVAPFVVILAFSSQNFNYISRYVSVVITTMLELPFFVLSVFLSTKLYFILRGLSFTLVSLISFVLSKMSESASNWLDNSYIINSLLELIMTFFMMYLFFRIMISLHNQIFKTLEIKTADFFDNIADSIVSDSKSITKV